jgi:hypothetical protein
MRWRLAALAAALTVLGAAAGAGRTWGSAPADEDPPLQPPADNPISLACVATALPVGRAANTWRVHCTLRGAPAEDTSFAVRAFAPDGRPVCEGELSAGEGSCDGMLTVLLDEAPPDPPAFFAETRPSGGSAADLAPRVRPLRFR